MFSRPVKSRPKPAPSSSSATARPPTSTRPASSGTMPARTRSVDVLPAPLRPTMPTVSPRLHEPDRPAPPDAQRDAVERLHGLRPAVLAAPQQRGLERPPWVGPDVE